ncbi:uncharacterized protein [Littorina saxatilis]|uniref:uncharacterized protein n=1 Tax=Littorina saxatilis TaxID=31220 RepID=UPI0038B4805F
MCCVCYQLRVVRAFKSTLEDLEDKRSVHSFHSFHSLRSSRSHHGPRTITEEANANANSNQTHNHDRFLRTTPPRLTSPNYTSVPPSFRVKSQSFENVPLVSKQPSPIMASSNPGHKASPPKTLSHSDIASHRSETSM